MIFPLLFQDEVAVCSYCVTLFTLLELTEIKKIEKQNLQNKFEKQATTTGYYF